MLPKEMGPKEMGQKTLNTEPLTLNPIAETLNPEYRVASNFILI